MIELVVFLPLAAFLIAGIGNRAIGNVPAKVITIGSVFVACGFAWQIFLDLLSGTPAYNHVVAEWITSGALSIEWSLRVDMLTAVMLVVVTTVSALVHLYSWGYMEEDPDQPRFFAYLSLFTFVMLVLVTANNLPQMFFGWEGVGLASYLLIGFWYEKPAAYKAGIKSFIMNRVGDFSFLLGIFSLFMLFKTTEIDTILASVPQLETATYQFLGMQVNAVTATALLLFGAAIAKSAQVPLHTWLPDAMEGPTPVSALIHAATMVTAGVFLVCRMSPLFAASDVASNVVIYVGAITCLLGATVAIVQNDIKKVIAYSTCSQLGYMFFAAGVGAYGAAMFHLFTHAFFKALLFLGSGAIIKAMHHEQDMRYYGGLYKVLPYTFVIMLIGTVAITGVNFTSGFYSKDAIIFAAWQAGDGPARFAFYIGVFAALLTSLYSWRIMFMTFFGKVRWAGSPDVQHALAAHGSAGHAGGGVEGSGGFQPKEAPLVMALPLAVLGFGSLFAGYLTHQWFIGGADAIWNGSLVHNIAFYTHLEDVPAWVHWAPFAAMAIGLLVAFYYYLLKPGAAAGPAKAFRPLYQFLVHKWYFDEFWDLVAVRFGNWVGRVFWHGGDEKIIDRFGPNGVAAAVVVGSIVNRRFQSGYVYTYALVMLLGISAFTAWFMVY